MNQNEQNPMELRDQMLAERLSKQNFELTPEQRELIAITQKPALLMQVPRTLLCGDSQAAYRHLTSLSETEDLNLLQASHFINLHDRVSPTQLGMTLDEYADYLERMQEVIELWNKIVNPMKVAAEREAMAMIAKKIHVPKKKIIHLPNSKN